MPQKVVIIGHGYTSRLSLARSLGQCGCDVTLIVISFSKKNNSHQKPIDCYSKYVSRFFVIQSNRELLINVLLEKCIDMDQKVLLLPDSDFSASVVDENLEQLSQYFICPNIKCEQGAIVTWMDKLRQKSAASANGLNVANGWKVSVRKGIFDIPSGITYPCFPKPLATIHGGKRGLKKCNNEAELRQVIQVISQGSDCDVLVEEYLNITGEYALLGCSTSQGIIIPAFIHTTSLANGGHFGVAKTGEVIPISDYTEIVEQFKSLMQFIGFVGLFDIDFFECDGKFYFGEINFRFGGSGYAITACGINLPELYLKDIQGIDISDEEKMIYRKATFVNERMCVDDWMEGYISTREQMKLLQSDAIHFVKNEDDPGPYNRLKKVLPMLYAKRIAKQILHK